jgi:hypothetical protein
LRTLARMSAALDGHLVKVTCVTSGCASFVTVVQAADFGECDHAAFVWSLHAAWRGRVFCQGEMGSRFVLVENISGERAPQMRLVEDDHVIEALAAHGTDQTLRIRILPRT